MSERIRNLQFWLNQRGAYPPLLEDGEWGPITRATLIEVFRNTSAAAVTDADIEAIAGRLGCAARQIKAVARVEGAGAGWDKDGLLKLLWERHYLWRRVKIALPLLSNSSPGGYTTDTDKDGINDSWEKLADATGLFGFNVAAECASVGKFQVMGAHWKALGYRSVADFYWRLSRSEAEHYEVFARYIEVNGLLPALRCVDGNPTNAEALAFGYNGSGGVAAGYHTKIAEAFRLEQ